MRLHFDFSEYEGDEDGKSVVLTVNLPEGQSHTTVTEIYEKAISILYGYDIGSSHKPIFNFSFEEDDEEDEGCPNCVQGTCGVGCNKRQTEMEF